MWGELLLSGLLIHPAVTCGVPIWCLTALVETWKAFKGPPRTITYSFQLNCFKPPPRNSPNSGIKKQEQCWRQFTAHTNFGSVIICNYFYLESYVECTLLTKLLWVKFQVMRCTLGIVTNQIPCFFFLENKSWDRIDHFELAVHFCSHNSFSPIFTNRLKELLTIDSFERFTIDFITLDG